MELIRTGCPPSSGRRPRAHTPADAPPAQHHAMLRARCQLHSLLATVQCAVAAADHNCCNTAFHYTTQHTSELRRRIRRADTIASAHDSPRGAFRCSSPHCLPFCSAQRSPCCSACCEDCCTAAPSRRPSSSARLPSTVSSSNATCDAATSLPPTTCAPADRPQHQRLAPHHPQHLPSCSATACGTSEWTTFLGTTSARDFESASSAARPLPPTTCAPADHLQHQRLAHLVIHNILHCVRHLPGGLESPAAAPPLRGACRRLHASGTRKHPKLTASQASEPPSSALCHDNPTPLPCVTSSRVHRLLLLCV